MPATPSLKRSREFRVNGMRTLTDARRVEQALRITGFDGTEYRTEPLAAPFLNIVN